MPRSSLVAGVLGGRILALGGMRGFLAASLDPDPLHVTDVFDPVTRRWEEQHAHRESALALPAGIHSASAAVVPRGLLSAEQMLVITGGFANGVLACCAHCVHFVRCV